MRHIDQVEWYFAVMTNKGIRYYECFSLGTVYDMAAQDDLIITEVLGVERNPEDIIDFCAFYKRRNSYDKEV